ncbi:replication restart helicase PriA [Trichlorobacter ammonificans]|uniref:Replication restart protein PriA n=1 Tax=Trichlorobacter ammonificans TaxID=2916410 RepID=A0ABN8HI87_9BACT|nr:primosomal protein N' [Trichlorobacter ammonificans]CAH2030556.1 Primosomal protein N' [Trichlorobacter ammonificans]
MPLPVATIEVSVPLPLEGSFHYAVPESLAAAVRPGIRVLVPFGRRTVSAYVLGCGGAPDGQSLKSILELLDDEPLWSEQQLAFFRWIADYYLHPLGEVLKTALPAGINRQSRKKGDASVLTGGRTIRTERWYRRGELDRNAVSLRGKSLEILAWVEEAGAVSAAEVKARFGDCAPQLKKLRDTGLLLAEQREAYRNPFAGVTVERDLPKPLSRHQQAALDAVAAPLDSATFAPFLLHGVTGSGKTEVYLQTIARSLADDRTALVLVPEISLTPQLVHRFRARFGDGIAVLHSALSDGERYDEWRRIRRGEVRIVIGARSAIFAPLERIGIIVVDEEHEASFKQSDGLRYNARDLALVRGRQEGAVVLLGSATPLVTTRHAARNGRLGYLELPERIGSRPLPETRLVTERMTAEQPLSPPLLEALAHTLARGEQSLIFLNRRGFASFLACPACGAQLSCPNCSVSLTYHKSRSRSICHYCDYQVPFPCICPACGEPELREMGAGTERVEHELAARFPEARVARMDSDTVAGKGGHARILDRVARGEVDILVGTQMIAKGHDFPGVTLVGVLQAEGSLYLPDFRAAERTFQLLSQVIGRAGRGELPGRVLVQALQPDHYALVHAVNHDYDQFCSEELAFREELGYPPFGHLAALLFSGTSETAVSDAATEAARLLVELKVRLKLRTELLGPAQAPFYRLRGRFRRHLLLKDADRSALRRLLTAYRKERVTPVRVREAVDVDPVDLL